MADAPPRGDGEAKARGGCRRGGRGRARGPGEQRRASCPWINSQIIAASEQGVQQLLATTTAHLGQMNLVNLSTAIHRLAKVTAGNSGAQAELRRHPVLRELQAAILLALEALEPSAVQPQSLSNIVWSLATLRLNSAPLLQAATTLAVTSIADFKPFEMSTTLWALAKLGSVDDSTTGKQSRTLFYAAANHMTNNLHQFGFRCLATVVWSFATARQRNPRLFRGIAMKMIPMVHAANCQEIANTAWAFGTAGFHDDQLFFALAERALLHLPEFKPQELSNLLWGLATNGFFHEGLFSASGLEAQRMDLHPQHLANILWAFSRVQPHHPATQRTTLSLLPLCTSQLEAFKPQEGSSTALAVAKALAPAAQYSAPDGQAAPPPPRVAEFFRAVVPWLMTRLPEFSAQSLANMVTAFVAVRMPCSAPVVGALGQEVVDRCDCFEPSALVHLLKAFALAPPDAGCAGVLEVLVSHAEQHAAALRPKELQALQRVRADLGDRGQPLRPPSGPEEGVAEVPLQPSPLFCAVALEYLAFGEEAQELPCWGHPCLQSREVPLLQVPPAAVVTAEHPPGHQAAPEFPHEEHPHLASREAPLHPDPPAEEAPWSWGGQSFRCSVKNSFLHFSDADTEYGSAPQEGSASQRSSSAPGRFMDEHLDDWHRRNPEHRIEREQQETDWNEEHPELRALDFDWGAARSMPQIPAGMFTEDNEPTRGPLAAALAAARFI